MYPSEGVSAFDDATDRSVAPLAPRL